ncbi:MAG: non-canonical purine NTP pyrophosphatase [Gammaproteobacteria bacterium]|nr:non-canonical purine NTP pyrophosphatase [Gammaproteobacteria bacterium]
MDIILATNNAGKLAELYQLLGKLPYTYKSLKDFALPSPAEPYDSFVENALLKARNASLVCQMPAIADDAGLCVRAFGGAPGVHTADYAKQLGYDLTQPQANVHALLHEMQKVEDRFATMVSVLVAVRSPRDPLPLIAMGTVSGYITPSTVGSHGFGYDPVFCVEKLGITFAQMSMAEKLAHSHRGKAGRRLVDMILEHW